MLHRIFVAGIVIFALSLSVYAQTYHSGAQEEDWEASGNPHIVNGDCEVNSPYEITIEAGCEVYFDGFYEIRVNGGGTLLVPGTTSSPVLFTSNQANPAAGDWKALIAEGSNLESLAIIELANCEISYGGETFESGNLNAEGPVRLKGYAEVMVEDCYIHHCLGAGVDFGHYSVSDHNVASVTGCKLENCEVGINIDYPEETGTDWDTEALDNYVAHCSGFGLYVHLGNEEYAIDIRYNRIEDCRNGGIHIFEKGGSIYNNVINGAGDPIAETGHGIQIVSYSGGTFITNNIIMNCEEYCIAIESPLTVENNCYYNYGNEDPYDPDYVTSNDEVDADPKLVAAYGDDNYYHLLWNSPCLAQGEGTNANPATSAADIGAYGGGGTPYFVCIAGGGVYGTRNQDASPYHVLADFTNPSEANPLTMSANGCDCVFLFAENTGLTVYTQLNIQGQNYTNMVILDRLEANEYWDGITMAVGSEGDFDWAEIRHADDGLSITDASVTVDTCKIQDCTGNGISVEYADFWMDTTIVSNNGGIGLFVFDGVAKLQRNYIHRNDAQGIYAQNLAGLLADATLPRDGYNDIVENGDVEIKLVSDTKAHMHDGHNNVVDERTPLTYLMQTSNNSVNYPRNDVEHNWWGTISNLSSRFDPSILFDWDPYDRRWNDHPAGRDDSLFSFESLHKRVWLKLVSILPTRHSPCTP